MIGKTLNYISHHAIAILALVCSLLALAGASYAATQLPKNSVGTAQIKQGAVTPSKLSGKQIGGYVRMYAVVDANGKLQYSSPQAKLSNWGNSSTPGGFSFGTVIVEADRLGEAVRGVRNTRRRRSDDDERRRDHRAELCTAGPARTSSSAGPATRRSRSRSSATEHARSLMRISLRTFLTTSAFARRRVSWRCWLCAGDSTRGLHGVLVRAATTTRASFRACCRRAGL